MDGFEKETYGERIASIYDALHRPGEGAATTSSIDEITALLAGLADGRPALELAIGTGRVALPLAARGVEVSGIDISPAMVGELRAKPGGAEVPVVIGDFADVGIDGEFGLVYLVFNTIFALIDEADQRRCFANVAAHLAPGGVFVVEAFLPDLDRFVDDQTLRVRSIDVDRVVLEASRHHPEAQRVESQHVVLHDGGVSLYPIVLRYAWPDDLDEMAAAAGLRPRERYADWSRRPFTDDSLFHISVYEKP